MQKIDYTNPGQYLLLLAAPVRGCHSESSCSAYLISHFYTRCLSWCNPPQSIWQYWYLDKLYHNTDDVSIFNKNESLIRSCKIFSFFVDLFFTLTSEVIIFRTLNKSLINLYFSDFFFKCATPPFCLMPVYCETYRIV